MYWKPLIFLSLLLSTLTLSAESRLQPHGDAMRLIVSDKPYIIIGGETGNSMASSSEDISQCIRSAKAHGYNTVLFPATWDLIEPQKGEFDFSLVDEVIHQSNDADIKVIFLWFGAWKNSMSCYAPLWVKQDIKSFPRAKTKSGKPLEICSAFSKNLFDADAAAFTALLKHIKNTDKDGTVIMLQIENEIGMLEDARDHSKLAEAEYRKGVPVELINYLNINKKSLHPTLLNKWQEAGMKQSGNWKDLFGDDIYTDEIFMAYNYAKYVEGLAKIARSIFPTMPLYVNAALNSRGRKPGEYPSAGPLAHLKDIWHAGAPTIDLLSLDLYDKGFTDWMAAYALPDNPLFVPEIKTDDSNPAQLLYVVGEHNALGLSPFAFNLRANPASVARQKAGNDIIRSLTPILTDNLGKGTMNGFYFDSDSSERTIERDGVCITGAHYFTLPWDPRATDGSPWMSTGGLIINIAPMEYIIAGTGIVVTFNPADMKNPASTGSSSQPKLGEDGFLLSGDSESNVTTSTEKISKRIGLGPVNEITVNPDGSFTRIRTLNGDETHQGRHVRIGVDDYKILHVKLYEYK